MLRLGDLLMLGELDSSRGLCGRRLDGSDRASTARVLVNPAGVAFRVLTSSRHSGAVVLLGERSLESSWFEG